jgi:hypothetical protein
VAQFLDVQQTPGGCEADCPQRGQVIEPFADAEVNSIRGNRTGFRVQVPPRTPKPVRSPQNGHRLNTLAGHLNTSAARLPLAGAALYSRRQP